MPNIKPVSDLRNYNEVLKDIAFGEPVFLTKNGRGCYAILDMKEYEHIQAAVRLMSELAKGRQSGLNEGYSSLKDVEEKCEVWENELALSDEEVFAISRQLIEQNQEAYEVLSQ